MNTCYRKPGLALIACAVLTLAGWSSMPSSISTPPTASTSQNMPSTITLIMGELKFSKAEGYQELEEGLDTKPTLKPGKKMFAPIQNIIALLGGEASLDSSFPRSTFADLSSRATKRRSSAWQQGWAPGKGMLK